MRLLLLEDDALLGDGLSEFLRTEGHVVDWCKRLLDAQAREHEPYDALLIDWQLPDGSGVDWIRTLRKKGIRTPIIVITAQDRIHDRVKGLDAGADDYLVKPFAPEELVARLRALQRRSTGAATSKIQVGDAVVDLDGQVAYLDGERILITQREWRVLEALLQRAGRVVSKNDLESLMLGLGEELASNSLEVHISRLRRKLGANVIETVRGIGYKVTV